MPRRKLLGRWGLGPTRSLRRVGGASDDREDFLSQAADAVAWNHEVHWDRCAGRATPAGRRTLDNLRALAPVFAGADSARREPAAAARAADPVAEGIVHRVVTVLMVIAALELAAAVVLLPWRWGDYHRAHDDIAVYLAILLGGHGASAALLLFAGRRDRRTWLLGGYFLFRATAAPLHMLPAFLGQMPPADLLQASIWEMPRPTMALLHLGAFLALAIAPAFLWAFARECPRVRRRTGLDDLARRMVPVSLAINGVLWVAVVSAYVAGLVDEEVGAVLFVPALDAAVVTSNVMSLAAVVVVALRAHTAPPAEVRRVVLFSLGLLVWMGMATAYDLVEALSPGLWLSNYESGSVLGLMQPMRFPGMVLLWYAVLAARIPHPREAAREACRRLLTRRGRLWLTATVPLAGLAWLVASRPERAVSTVLADPPAQALFAAAALLLLLLAGREEILARLDAWTFPETADQRRLLASATAALGQATGLATLRRTVRRTVKRGCGSPATLLATGDATTDGRDFRAADTRIPSLPAGSAIVHMLETAGGSLRVHPSDETSVYWLLPSEEAAWVAETGADAVVPLPGPGAELVGLLVVGRRFDDRTVRTVDVPFLEALGAVAGLAVARLRLLEAPTAGSSEPPPARACAACGCVTEPDEPPGCQCGAAHTEIGAPKLLAGKYRLARRLGAGGMGAVYLARDLQLERYVAVKTLADASVSRLAGLKQEARAMATVTHAAVAQIHGVESWRGRPFLVVEHLAGGTLADRLRQGPAPAAAAVSMVAVLGDALGALHRAGYLHGDVKPSNVGFTSDGSPKLLDFGMARETNDPDTLGGTLAYMSPEVLAGHPAEETDDVWSLCVVLHESVSGQHPFTGGANAGETRDRIRRQQLVDVYGSQVSARLSSAVVAFTASLLTAPRATRPATARAFVHALDAAVAVAVERRVPREARSLPVGDRG
ncbi:MAG: serine/threonine-protein kinase [Acidobacteria bacterium]|nr:serine/threonine-protein kinase [Acidobacteriota bacterium]